MARKSFPWPWLVLAMCLFLLFWRAGLPDAQPVDAVQDMTQTPKLVALTFDDGPKPRTTPRLLEELDKRGVKATFFLIGAQVEESPELVVQMAQSGHQLGIHTYDHVSLTELSHADFDAQVDRTRQVLAGLLGYDSFLLRPPYGLVDSSVKAYAGAPIILWSVDPEDWHDRSVQREVAHIVSEAGDGDIILMHDIFPESVDAALQVIDQLHQAGYAFVTVEELFSARGVALEPGKVYRSCPPPQ